jgi:hypothetical protein
MKISIALYVLLKMIGYFTATAFCFWVYIQLTLFIADLYKPYVANPELLAFVTPIGIIALGMLLFIMYCDEETKRGKV